MRGFGERADGYDTPEAVDFVTGACMLVRREVFETIGLLPTFYFFKWDDIDLCTQAREAGFEVLYWPNAEILHERHASVGSEAVDTGLVVHGFRNRIWFYRRHSGSVPEFVYLFTTISVLLPVYVSYYLLNDYDTEYVIAVLRGIYWGFVTDPGEPRHPDSGMQERSRHANRVPSEL